MRHHYPFASPSMVSNRSALTQRSRTKLVVYSLCRPNKSFSSSSFHSMSCVSLTSSSSSSVWVSLLQSLMSQRQRLRVLGNSCSANLWSSTSTISMQLKLPELTLRKKKRASLKRINLLFKCMSSVTCISSWSTLLRSNMRALNSSISLDRRKKFFAMCQTRIRRRRQSRALRKSYSRRRSLGMMVLQSCTSRECSLTT